MNISILKDDRRGERRVPLTPRGAQELGLEGFGVMVEAGAGAGAGFIDEHYEEAGCRVVRRRVEAVARADIIVGIGCLGGDDLGVVRPGTPVLSVRRVELSSAEDRQATLAAGVQAIAIAHLRDEDGHRPVVARLGELAGALAPQIAARMMQSGTDGRFGVYLGSLPGIPPADVGVIGAGSLGQRAARAFASMGAAVYLLDNNFRLLEQAGRHMPANVTTVTASPRAIAQTVRFADVLVTAAHQFEGGAPLLVTEEMVRSMRAGSCILDFSVDEGGCVETSRPIASPDDVYEVHGVLHFTMPNATTLVARTASRVLSQAIRPFIVRLAEGADPATDPAFCHALYQGDAA